MTRELEIDVIVRDVKGGKVFKRKKAGLRKTLRDLNAFMEEKYEQKNEPKRDVPPIMGEIPPGW